MNAIENWADVEKMIRGLLPPDEAIHIIWEAQE